jgi:hypothetical protein
MLIFLVSAVPQGRTIDRKHAECRGGGFHDIAICEPRTMGFEVIVTFLLRALGHVN